MNLLLYLFILRNNVTHASDWPVRVFAENNFVTSLWISLYFHLVNWGFSGVLCAINRESQSQAENKELKWRRIGCV